MKLSAFLVSLVAALVSQDKETYGANPIRKVVNLLQAMQKKVTEEGEKEEELYEKFQCYCKKNTGALTDSIAEAQTKIAQLETQVKEDTAAKSQVDEELKNHKADRVEAQGSLKAATKQREKENAEYTKESGDTGTNIAGLGKAIEALEKGLGGGSAFLQNSFLQSETAAKLKTLILASGGRMSDVDRDSVTSFLSGSASAPGTSEIVGILKEMKDEFSRDLNGIDKQEETAQKAFEEMSAAKKKEIAAATTAIESKTQRSGELAVKIVEGKNDLKDTTDSLSEDEQFQVNLRKGCAEKETEMQERTKTRAEELQAIAETIKVLNDDDALDLFKKTLPSPGGRGSFIQRDSFPPMSAAEHARSIITEASHTYKNLQLDFISLALKGKKVDFSKVIALIDNLVTVLAEEQKEDNSHKAYCEKELDTSDDTKGGHQRRIEGLTHEQDEAKTVSKNLAGEIKLLTNGIAQLDKSVAEATEQRKNEHEEFTKTAAENQQALQLIEFAKNRLNKFYNPKLHKAPPARELSEEERVYSNYGGQVDAFIQLHSFAAPPPPPETFGAYSKKSSETGGVIALIDMLANDLKKDSQQAANDEKTSQSDYEELMVDSQKKRAADAKLITTKEGAKAEADGVAETAAENLASSKKELYLTNEYISNLHKSCDFLLENYEFRQAARSQEVDALKNAKATLKGADYSFLQLAKETPCITMCRELNQYPNCACPNFTYDATPGHMTFDELWTKIDQIIESGRTQLKEARKNA